MRRTKTGPERLARAEQTLAVFALVALLAGCSLLPRGGQTAEAAIRQAKSIPGSTVSVLSGGAYDGLQKHNSIIVSITIEPGFHVQNPDKLVDFLIRLGWSVNDNRPGRDLLIGIDSPAPIDAMAAAKGAGWKSASSLSDDSPGVFIDLKEAEKRLGGWPGKVPATPAGMVVKDPASPDPSTQ